MVPQASSKPLRVIERVPFIGGAPAPKPEDVIFITYPDTFDGWLAAWVVRKAAKDFQLHVEMQIDYCLSTALEGRLWIGIGGYADNVFPVTAPRQLLTIGCAQAAEPMPFAHWERQLPFGVKQIGLVSDTQKYGFLADKAVSLAAHAWVFFYSHRAAEPVPRLLQANEDVVSGNLAYNFSTALVECAKSYSWDFRTLDKLIEACDDRKRRENMIIAGQAICRYIDKNSSK